MIRADDTSTTDGSGDKIVKVRMGGGTIPVRVVDTDPYSHLKSEAPQPGDKYDPERFSFSATSSMAGKSFDLPTNSLAHSDAEFTDAEHSTFHTQTADESARSATSIPGLDTKSEFANRTAFSRDASDLNKSYITASADSDLTRAAVLPASATSDDQNRKAILGGQDESSLFGPSTLADKQYLGPGAQHVPDGINVKENVVISRMSDLPNRPLTVDEVRDLINHETIPNTNEKPDEPSKPLNDPNYKPEPLRDDPSPGTPDEPSASAPPAPPFDDDKNDPVPPPGTIAQPPPENNVPLPQR